MTNAPIKKNRFSWRRAFALGLFYGGGMAIFSHWGMGRPWIVVIISSILGGLFFGICLEYFFMKRLQKHNRVNDHI